MTLLHPLTERNTEPHFDSRIEPYTRGTVDMTLVPDEVEVERPTVCLQTLGAAVVRTRDARIDPSAGLMFALVVRLAYAPGMRVARDTLLRDLWPGQPTSRQRANLRQALYKLRHAGVRAVQSGDMVELDESQVVRSFSLSRTAEAFARDVTSGSEPFGVFLPGYVGVAPEFAEWIERVRDVVHADVRRVLVGELRTLRERAEWSGAETLARWLLQFDSLNEEATLTLAECTALAGGKAAAVAMLDRYLAEVGEVSADLRLPATLLRRRIADPPSASGISFTQTERHFMGREEELAALTQLMRRTRWHDGCVVLLHGPPGMGKSRVATELGKVAIIEGLRAYVLQCREADVTRPLALLLDAVPDLLTLPGALGCAPEHLRTLKRWLPQLTVPANVEDTSDTPSGRTDGSVGFQNPSSGSLRRAVLDLLAAVSEEKPLLLVVEDTHWIDDASWSVLSDLAERAGATRTFALMTSREPHPCAVTPERVPGALVVRRLEPLRSEHSRALALAIGADLSAPMSDELADWFVRAGEGVPLYLRSLVNHWIESGEAGGVPPTLAHLIERRLDKLGTDALRALQTITLLGSRSTVRRLQRVLGVSLHTLLASLETLHRVGAVVDADGTLVTGHELVSKSAIGRLSRLMKSAINEKIATVLSSELRQDSEPIDVLSAAEHWLASGNTELLWQFVLLRFDKLLASGHPSQALRVLQALDPGTKGQGATHLLQNGKRRLLVEAGEYRLALELRGGLEALPKVDSKLSEEEANVALSLFGSVFRSDPVVNYGELSRFIADVTHQAHLGLSTRFRAAEIGIILASNTFDESLAGECIVAVSSSATAASTPLTRVELMYHTSFGDLDRARDLARVQFARASAVPATTDAYLDCSRAGYALRFGGPIDESIAALARSFEIAMALDLPRLAQFPAWQLAQICLDVGDRAGASEWTRTLLRLVDGEDLFASSFARAHFCRVALDEGRAADAEKYLAEYSRGLPRSPTVRASGYHLALQIGLRLLDMSWHPSQTFLASALARFETCARFACVDFFAAVLVDAMVRAGRIDDAKTLQHRYINELRREKTGVAARLSASVERLREATRRAPSTA